MIQDAAQRKYYETHREQRKARRKAYYWAHHAAQLAYTRNYNLKRFYGITTSEYVALLARQNERCAICRTPAIMFSDALHVDHSHITKKVRGLLCSSCNNGLGRFKDSGVLLRAAALYLQK